MAEYERSRLVQASPDEVFAFVSDASNLATFLPTVDTVEPQAEGRVEIHGEVQGRAYEDDGWFRVDEAQRRTSLSLPTSRRRVAQSPGSRRPTPTRSSKVWRQRSTRSAISWREGAARRSRRP